MLRGGIWVWNQREAIWDGVQWTGRAIGGLFLSKSDRVDWDNVNDNTKHHILNGTDGSHQDGWRRFGFDPNDPNSYDILLPFLQEAINNGEETIKNVKDGRVLEYIYTIAEKGFTIWVKVFEHPDGSRVLSDAAEYIAK